MKASEAAKIADEATSLNTSTMYQTALQLIERKANEGERYANTGYLNTFAATQLEELGYKITTSVDREGSLFYRISW